MDKAPLKWKAITYLLIDTGCRRGEAVGLKWECVDLEEGIITIERTLSYTAKTGIYEGPTKTGNTRVLQRTTYNSYTVNGKIAVEVDASGI